MADRDQTNLSSEAQARKDWLLTGADEFRRQQWAPNPKNAEDLEALGSITPQELVDAPHLHEAVNDGRIGKNLLSEETQEAMKNNSLPEASTQPSATTPPASPRQNAMPELTPEEQAMQFVMNVATMQFSGDPKPRIQFTDGRLIEDAVVYRKDRLDDLIEKVKQEAGLEISAETRKGLNELFKQDGAQLIIRKHVDEKTKSSSFEFVPMHMPDVESLMVSLEFANPLRSMVTLMEGVQAHDKHASKIPASFQNLPNASRETLLNSLGSFSVKDQEEARDDRGLLEPSKKHPGNFTIFAPLDVIVTAHHMQKEMLEAHPDIVDDLKVDNEQEIAAIQLAVKNSDVPNKEQAGENVKTLSEMMEDVGKLANKTAKISATLQQNKMTKSFGEAVGSVSALLNTVVAIHETVTTIKALHDDFQEMRQSWRERNVEKDVDQIAEKLENGDINEQQAQRRLNKIERRARGNEGMEARFEAAVDGHPDLKSLRTQTTAQVTGDAAQVGEKASSGPSTPPTSNTTTDLTPEQIQDERASQAADLAEEVSSLGQAEAVTKVTTFFNEIGQESVRLGDNGKAFRNSTLITFKKTIERQDDIEADLKETLETAANDAMTAGRQQAESAEQSQPSTEPEAEVEEETAQPQSQGRLAGVMSRIFGRGGQKEQPEANATNDQADTTPEAQSAPRGTNHNFESNLNNLIADVENGVRTFEEAESALGSVLDVMREHGAKPEHIQARQEQWQRFSNSYKEQPTQETQPQAEMQALENSLIERITSILEDFKTAQQQHAQENLPPDMQQNPFASASIAIGLAAATARETNPRLADTCLRAVAEGVNADDFPTAFKEGIQNAASQQIGHMQDANEQTPAPATEVEKQ